MTDAEAVAVLEAWCHARATPRTAWEYKAFLRRFLTFKGDAPFEFAVVVRWIATIPPSSFRLAVASLKHAYGKKAIEWDELPRRRYRRDEPRLRRSLLSAEDRIRLRSACRTPRERAMIETLWILRRAEAAALRWADVDLAAGVAMIHHGKGDKSAVQKLPEVTRAALAAWHAVLGAPADGPVFPNDDGEHLTPYALGERLRVFLEAIGFWWPGSGASHRFRRTFATEYLRANPSDLEGLRCLMRHESIGTTARYIFLDERDLAQRLERVAL
jgi:integrase